jgi:hypothetical protein
MVASSQSHSGWVRWSHQMSAGRRTSPCRVEHDAAVHLAGEGDGLNLGAVEFGGGH